MYNHVPYFKVFDRKGIYPLSKQIWWVAIFCTTYLIYMMLMQLMPHLPLSFGSLIILSFILSVLVSTVSAFHHKPTSTNIMSSSSPSTKRAKTSTTSSSEVTAGYMMKMPPLSDKRAVAEQLCQTCSGPIYSQGLETFQVPSKSINKCVIASNFLQHEWNSTTKNQIRAHLYICFSIYKYSLMHFLLFIIYLQWHCMKSTEHV